MVADLATLPLLTCNNWMYPCFERTLTLLSWAVVLLMLMRNTGVAPFIGFLEHRAAQIRLAAENHAAATSGYWRGGFDIEGLTDDEPLSSLSLANASLANANGNGHNEHREHAALSSSSSSAHVPAEEGCDVAAWRRHEKKGDIWLFFG